jgi:hypothetical protein
MGRHDGGAVMARGRSGAGVESAEITTRYAVCRLEENGVVRKVTTPDAEYKLADAQEELDAIRQIGGGRRCPLLADIRYIKSIDQEARAFYGSPEGGKVVSAVALLVGSPLSRMIGNFFLRLQRPSVPIKLFTSDAAAMEWLVTFVETP